MGEQKSWRLPSMPVLERLQRALDLMSEGVTDSEIIKTLSAEFEVSEGVAKRTLEKLGNYCAVNPNHPGWIAEKRAEAILQRESLAADLRKIIAEASIESGKGQVGARNAYMNTLLKTLDSLNGILGLDAPIRQEIHQVIEHPDLITVIAEHAKKTRLEAEKREALPAPKKELDKPE